MTFYSLYLLHRTAHKIFKTEYLCQQFQNFEAIGVLGKSSESLDPPMRLRSLESQSYEAGVFWYHQAMNESMPHVSRILQFELRLWRFKLCRWEEAISTYWAIKNDSLHTCANERADFVIRWEGPTNLRQPWPEATKGDMPGDFWYDKRSHAIKKDLYS